METCQTAGNEFLRQFWSAIYPSAFEVQRQSAPPVYKEAKADRMVEYIARTPAKIEALVQEARASGADPERVQSVFHQLVMF